MLLSEFGFTFGSNFTSAVRSAFRNLFEFSVRNTKAMGSDRKLLASWYKNESTVRDTMGVKIIGMSTLLTRNVRSFVDAKFFVQGARPLLLGSVE